MKQLAWVVLLANVPAAAALLEDVLMEDAGLLGAPRWCLWGSAAGRRLVVRLSAQCCWATDVARLGSFGRRLQVSLTPPGSGRRSLWETGAVAGGRRRSAWETGAACAQMGSRSRLFPREKLKMCCKIVRAIRLDSDSRQRPETYAVTC